MWESDSLFIVLGISNKEEKEVFLDKCQKDSIPIIKRASGGGTVLQGPGCLNYSLVLQIKEETNTITSTNKWILSKQKKALQTLTKKPIQVKGHTDLTINQKKFSGNAQKRKRKTILFHGTILYNFQLEKIDYYLKHPPKEPPYRKKRSHDTFITNVKVPKEKLISALQNEWNIL